MSPDNANDFGRMSGVGVLMFKRARTATNLLGDNLCPRCGMPISVAIPGTRVYLAGVSLEKS
jgi:hypothetical protein